MEIQELGKLQDDTKASLLTIENKNGMRLSMTDFGAAIVSLQVPDRDGRLVDVVLGYDKVADYETDTNAFGATIGRVGNRIAGAKFVIDGRSYALDANDGKQCLHGGFHGYHKRMWHYEVRKEECAIAFSLHSPDKDQGFPGALDIIVTYSLDEENGLHIRYFAISDDATPINMTNHTYFNLNGHDQGNIGGQEVTLGAHFFTEINDEVYPNGNIVSVKDTPLNFLEQHKIGDAIDADDIQIKRAGGYDHNYVLDAYTGEIRLVGKAYAPETGIGMEIYTDQPGMQFYTGNFVGDGTKGKTGAVYHKRGGYCFETQGYPDAVHYTHFPDVVYEAGEPYDTETIYKFTVK